MGVGANIRKLRKEANMTQPELAEKLGVHETTIRRWEQEKDKGPDVGMIENIAKFFNTSTDVLLSNVPDSNVFSNNLEEKDSLIYEWGGGHKLKLPNTAETRKMFENLVLKSMGITTAQIGATA